MIVLVEDGDGAPARAETPTLEPVASIDPTRPAARRAPTASGEPLAGDVAGGRRPRAGRVAAELVGVCERALEMTVAYVKERKQFGMPVGAYQAVSHRCAQMLLDTEKARAADVLRGVGGRRRSRAAGRGGGDGQGRRPPTPAARSPPAAIQLHGGIGFTWEADVHWLYKRAQVDAALLGGAKEHRARLAPILAQRAHGLAVA